MSEKATIREALYETFRCARDIEHHVPGRVLSIVLASVSKALTPYAAIWLSAQLIGELAGQRRPEELRRWVILTVAVTAVLGVLNLVLERWRAAAESLYNPMKSKMYAEKFFSMDYADVDDQKVRDLRAQIWQNENFQGWGINVAIQNIQSLVEFTAGILGAVALTVSLFVQKVPQTAGKWVFLNSPLFILGLLGLMLLIVWFGLSRNQIYNRKWCDMTAAGTLGNRLWRALFLATEDRKRYLDIRTYDQQELICGYVKRADMFSPGGSFDRLNRGHIGFLAALGENLSAVFTGAVYLFTCLKAWAGAFGIGAVTQYVAAATALTHNISGVLGALDQMRNNARFIRDTYALLEMPNKMYKGTLTTEKRADRQYDVEFRDVSFKYPGSDRWALRHVSMKFKVGSRLAVVGENGSGKTTFIKLLCRLYDPQEGEILLNGIDIRKYSYREYMDVFSVVFQDFQLLSQPLGNNVAGASRYDRQRAEKALIDAGFGDRLRETPQGLDTQLYKDFGENGVEISGGEAQKIAIARALYKDAPFIILDEPTAALDPVAEAEIYAKFSEITGDRTAIYISHRLSSCKFCDEIAVFQDGQVVQMGTHASLLAHKDGKYAELWQAQAQYYTENEEDAP